MTTATDRQRWPARTARSAANRQKILDAAERRFAAQGFTATPLAQIAADAGLTKGAVFSQFANKEDLLLEVLTRRRYDIDAPQSRSGSLSDRVAAAARGIARAAKRVDAAQVVLELEVLRLALTSRRVAAWIRDGRAASRRQLAQFLADASEQSGEPLPDSADHLALLLDSAWRGLHLTSIAEPGTVTPIAYERVARALVA